MNSEQVSESLFSSLEENYKLIESLGDELKFQAKVTLTAQIEKLGLVTREEFDMTLKQLERAQARLSALESSSTENSL